MNDKILSIIIKAQDQASKVIDGIGDSTKGLSEKVGKATAGMATLAAGAGVALYGLSNIMGDSIGAANKATAAMTGLNSVARAFGQDAGKAKEAAQSLARDGLMTVGDAASGLKNLLAAGFELPQAITLMNRFKDSAAFGRQGSLQFGQAIVAATEGIKNQNSILVDNAGVTKNLSVMLKEAGYSQNDLGLITSDTGVRMAIYNGILRETNAQQGDASKLADSFAGKQAKAAAQTTELQQNLGVALQSALLPFLQAITPIIVAVSQWVSENQRLAAAIAIGTALFLGIIVVLGSVLAAVGALILVFGSGAGLIIGSVVVISAAIAAAAAFIITNFDKVKHFFTVTLPDGIRAGLNAVPGIIFAIFNHATGGLLGIVWGMRSQILGALMSVASGISGALSGVWAALTSPFRAAADTIQGIINNIRGAISSIKNIGGKAWDVIKGAVPGFATGGYTGRGGTNEVAGIVHKGEYVVPKNQVDQNTGMPMIGGGGVTINMYGDTHMDSDTRVDQLAQRVISMINAQKEMGNLGVGI